MKKKNINIAADTERTTAAVQPGREYIRPGEARCIVGFSRSKLYELIAKGKVRSMVLRREGRMSGMRLVSVSSLRAYIESQAE